MLHPIVWIFLLLASMFAATHVLAVQASLYWYYWWFDIFMHFTGGVLITVGLHAIGTFKRFNRQPSFLLVLGVAVLFVIVWELFEWQAGLYRLPMREQLLDTMQDIANGLIGALLTYTVIKYIRK